jgi:deoxyribodipyrimidine photolyase-related protein
VDDVLEMDLPLASREGFIRQILGWREFVRHVHRATDGFRDLPRNVLGAEDELPPVFWRHAWPSRDGRAEASGLACLDRVLEQVWRSGYGHHITRLMVLSNLATLLDVDPEAVSEWFWVAYEDAYDWVVEPNVLGMGTFAVGEAMTTKPYVSGAAYIDRMGDFCASCRFDPRRNCPITSLYWAFMDRHAERLSSVGRMRLPLASCRKRGDSRLEQDREVFRRVRSKLASGKPLTPECFPERSS